MAIRTLVNRATIDGTLGGTPFDDTSTEAIVSIVGVTIDKVADKATWYGDDLEYTITVTADPAEGELAGVVITDQLDITAFSFIQDSLVLTVNGVAVADPDYTVSDTGLLTVNVEDVAGGITDIVITFRGSKVG